eukprot:1076765-Pleurochrysis_carterae.AAC.1
MPANVSLQRLSRGSYWRQEVANLWCLAQSDFTSGVLVVWFISGFLDCGPGKLSDTLWRWVVWSIRRCGRLRVLAWVSGVDAVWVGLRIILFASAFS